MLSHKHTHRLWAWIAGAGAALFYPTSAYAQNMGIFAAEQFIGTMVVKAITVINLLTWIMFGFLNYLLDPRFIFDMTEAGEEGAFMKILNQIWQLSRDITNIGFAVALVAAAVIMIVKADKSVISDKAGKFVLTIILVNFSWFIPRVILDVANVSTATIFGIPSLINQAAPSQCKYTSASAEDNCKDDDNDGTFECDCIIITNMQIFVDDWEELDDEPAWDCPGNELLCYKYETMEPDTIANYSAILNGLIVNHGRLRELGRVPAPLQGGNEISELVVFIMRELLLLVFHIAFFFPLLAMTVAFFIRIPVLWITMAFMPFYCLGIILPDGIKKLIGDKADEIMEQFLKAAFLPAIVAIPLSIGFIMINAGAQLTGRQAAGISIRLFDGVSNLHELMWMCMSMGVLWVGVFAALKDKGVMSKGTESIQNYGQSLGRLGANLALSAPIMPVPGGNALKFFKENHPAVLANAVQRDGWGALFDKDKGKKNDIEKSAKDFKPNQFRDLNRHLDKLKDAIKNDDKPGQEAAYRELDRMGVKGVENQTDVDSFMKELEKRGDLADGDKRTTRRLVDEVVAARPPAAPPADPKTAAFATAATTLAGTDAAAATLRTETTDLLRKLNTHMNVTPDATETTKVVNEIKGKLSIDIDSTSNATIKADLKKLLDDHIMPSAAPVADKNGMKSVIDAL